jgi:phosphate transport system permease protein
MAIATRLSTGPDRAIEITRAITSRGSDAKGAIFRALLQLALLISILLLIVLLIDQVTKGWDVLSTRFGAFLEGTLRSRPEDPTIGIAQGLVGSFWIAIFTAGFAFPTGIAAAIYLEEYAAQNRFTKFIDINIRNLAGVPSVVYGILGLAVIVNTFGLRQGAGGTLMAGGLTLAILVLPIVIITAAEAIRAVPDSLREAGYGVGATRWEVVRHHVLPYAAPGIITGTILSLARALGEAAPLILVGAVSGRLASDPSYLDVGQLTERFTAMPIVITTWAGRPETEFRALTAAAIVVLLAVVLLCNLTAILLRNRFEKKRGS